MKYFHQTAGGEAQDDDTEPEQSDQTSGGGEIDQTVDGGELQELLDSLHGDVLVDSECHKVLRQCVYWALASIWSHETKLSYDGPRTGRK